MAMFGLNLISSRTKKLNYLLYLAGFQRWIVFDELKNRRICYTS